VAFTCPRPEDKQRMLEMLKRLEEQSDGEVSAGCGLDVNSDPNESSLEERLAGLDLGRSGSKRATSFQSVGTYLILF
jgi:hypothetical protein